MFDALMGGMTGGGGYSFSGSSSADSGGDQSGGAFYGGGINKLPQQGAVNNQTLLMVGLGVLVVYLLAKK